MLWRDVGRCGEMLGGVSRCRVGCHLLLPDGNDLGDAAREVRAAKEGSLGGAPGVDEEAQALCGLSA